MRFKRLSPTSHAVANAALLVLLSCADRAPVDPERPASEPAPVALATVSAAIRAGALDRSDPTLRLLSAKNRSDLQVLYEPQGYAPLWVDLMGRLRPSAREALAILNDAAVDGLDPADYDVARIERLTRGMEVATSTRVEDLAACDLSLSAAMLQYLRHLREGRVDPRAIGFTSHLLVTRHDFPGELRALLAQGRISQAPDELSPPFVQYRALRTMLARYRSLAADAGLELPPFSRTVRPSAADPALPALGRLLVALGDLQPHTPASSERVYGGALVEGVKRFQVRHGLEPDGVVGRMTSAALRVPLARRVRQIELALERFRWLPELGGQRILALNIPMFHLWVWDSVPPTGEPAFGMRAIVGRALSTETPVFIGEMRSVIFRPYWSVPRSILLDEMLPLIERDPDYLNQQSMEIVNGPGDEAQPVDASPENLHRLRLGALRLRQRPGPRNALGLVKFVFENDENVYLHGTPAQELFDRARRDFSHGCVRVEDPVALAEWVLQEQPEWTEERVRAAMAAGQPEQVRLPRPIQVILFYITAAVMPEDGMVRFAADIYGHDTKLEQALARERPSGS